MHWYPDMDLGGWTVMMAAMALMWGLLVAAVVALVRTPPAGARREPHDPGRLLDERFARGEIDEGEYRARRRALGLGVEQNHAGTDR